MSLKHQHFEFDGFLLDAREKLLLRGGKPLPLTPKAFQLLLVLVENDGHLIEKDELMKAVWADSFVDEGNLSFTVAMLRRALHDSAQKPRYIETVPRRGYRFIAGARRVEREAAAAPDCGPVESSPASVDGRAFSPAGGGKDAAGKTRGGRSRRARVIVAAVVLIFLAAGSMVLGRYLLPRKNASAADRKSLAVLPLKPIDAARRDELYEIGIADSLIHRFGAMKNFVVRPLSAVRRYADIEQDPLAAGREQRVDYVLASNYQLSGGRIRVTAQLYDVADGRIVGTYKSEKDAGDVFAVQDAVAVELENVLLARFGAAENSAARRGTTSEEAYRLFLQGLYLYERRNLEDARKGVEALDAAVRLDPNYARAWARKAHLHRTIANHKRSTDIRAEYRKAIEAVDRALALDPNLADAYSALCDHKMYTEYDFAGAEKACRRAVELDPDSSLSHQIYARFLNSRGRADEAVAESRTAIDLDPTSLLNQRVYGTALYFGRRYDEAAAQFRRVAATDENFINVYHFFITTLELQGNHAEAFEWLMKWLALQKADEATQRAFREAYRTSGWPGVLRERIERFEQSDEAYFTGAAYHARLGNRDRAFELLNKSYQRRELWMANLQVDPRLDALRDDPRYAALVDLVEGRADE